MTQDLPRVTGLEMAALRALHRDFGSESDCLYMREIARRARVPQKLVRRVVRSLARKGCAEYIRGLFDDEGRVAGSGYRCTRLGARVVEAAEARP